MKNLLISLIFVSSVVSQVSAISWNDFSAIDYKAFSNSGMSFLKENSSKIYCGAIAIAGALVLYEIFRPRYSKKTIELNNEICTLFIRNSTVVRGTLEIDGVTTILKPTEASEKFTEMSRVYQESSRKMNEDFRQSKIQFDQEFNEKQLSIASKNSDLETVE